jgi:hypothetical protein
MNNDENIVLTETPVLTSTPTPQKEVKLVDVQVTDENTALNVMVSFLSLAHKRGAFGIDESAKIWECIRMFQKPMSVSM